MWAHPTKRQPGTIKHQRGENVRSCLRYFYLYKDLDAMRGWFGVGHLLRFLHFFSGRLASLAFSFSFSFFVVFCFTCSISMIFGLLDIFSSIILGIY